MEDVRTPRPAVTVVIPTYNRSELLRRAVASVLAQEHVTCELIVVDDGSTPPVMADDLPGDVTVVRNEGMGGVAAARDLAVRRARAPWVAFLDDDDWWAPEHLRRLCEAAGAAQADFAYAPTWDVILAEHRAVIRPAPSPVGLDEQMLRSNAIGTPSCVMVRRSLYLAVGGFDNSLSPMADWDLWLRLAEAGTAAASRFPTVAYAIHDTNMSLDMGRLVDEFHRLAERYAEPCVKAGFRFGEPGVARWIARLYRRQGLRGPAAAWYLRSARVPGHRLDLLRAVAVLLGEGAMGSGALLLGERRVTRAERRRPRQVTHPAPFAWLSAGEATPGPCLPGRSPRTRP